MRTLGTPGSPDRPLEPFEPSEEQVALNVELRSAFRGRQLDTDDGTLTTMNAAIRRATGVFTIIEPILQPEPTSGGAA